MSPIWRAPHARVADFSMTPLYRTAPRWRDRGGAALRGSWADARPSPAGGCVDGSGRCLPERAHPRVVVGAQIIEDHALPGTQRRHQDVPHTPEPRQCPWRPPPPWPLPYPASSAPHATSYWGGARHLPNCALSFRRTCIAWRQVKVTAILVDDDTVVSVLRAYPRSPRLPLLLVACGGCPCRCCRVQPKRASTRPSVRALSAVPCHGPYSNLCLLVQRGVRVRLPLRPQRGGLRWRNRVRPARCRLGAPMTVRLRGTTRRLTEPTLTPKVVPTSRRAMLRSSAASTRCRRSRDDARLQQLCWRIRLSVNRYR
jgi:hypothetical protein